MAETEGYRVPEVCRTIGITYRQLDYWARTGLVTPSIREAGGSGTQRLYSFQDLVVLKVIKKLTDLGVSLQRVRKSIAYLRQSGHEQPTGITLMSDGSSVYACESEDEIIDLVKRGQGVFAIALDRVWEDLSVSLGKRKRDRDRTRAGPRPQALAGAGGA
jgi:DNA-binding transcriptional MerR regulator